MRSKALFLVAILVLGITACLAVGEPTLNPITGASSFDLSENELVITKERALRGDAKSAFRMYQHYEMGRRDTVSAFPWLQIAANGNDVNAQYALGYTFAHVDLFKNIPLARFWLERAARNGSSSATQLLEELSDAK